MQLALGQQSPRELGDRPEKYKNRKTSSSRSPVRASLYFDNQINVAAYRSDTTPIFKVINSNYVSEPTSAVTFHLTLDVSRDPRSLWQLRWQNERMTTTSNFRNVVGWTNITKQVEPSSWTQLRLIDRKFQIAPMCSVGFRFVTEKGGRRLICSDNKSSINPISRPLLPVITKQTKMFVS